MAKIKKDTYQVLLVDDSADDCLFMRRAIRKSSRLKIVGEVRDGEVAVEYLTGEGEFSDRTKYPFPDVLLLDLKMPRRTGHEVLEWLRTRAFDDLAVIVVSGSFLDEDIARSMELGACGYFKKNAFQEEVETMVGAIENLLDNGK